jgi:hypothetical protein
MPCVDAGRLLDAWDAGATAGPARRARTILRQLAPHLEETRLGSMTAGERDRELLGVRRRLFGDALGACTPCRVCGQRLEIELDAGALLASGPRVSERSVTVRALDDIVIVAHPPSLADLELAAEAADADAAQALILRRCVESARRADEPIVIEDLPEAAIDALGTCLEAADPDCRIELQARCPGCHESSCYTLDVGAFLWAEIESEALRLLHDVHRLARGYGWRESDILAMSPVRRRAYLGMLPE